MATANRLTRRPLVHRLVINPFMFRLIFQSNATARFATQTKLLGGDDWLFFNYGYEEDPAMGIPLDAADEPHRYFIQLYHRTATQVDLAGKKVLECSCGHGGGASYLVRTQKPAAYTGLDLNPAGIEFAKNRHHLANLDFVEGNAQALPFPDESFDALVNVEASHLYPDVPKFLSEVKRVLKPGGHFLYTDFRPRSEIAEWEANLASSGLRQISMSVIDQNVLRGNEKNTPRKQERISQHHGSAVSRTFARYASDMTDWAFNGALRGSEYTYRVYLFTKD